MKTLHIELTPKEIHSELKAVIEKCNHDYYVLGESKVSDLDYDKLVEQLKEIEALHPEFKTKDSPTQYVGSKDFTTDKTIKHVIPMLSLDNTYNENDLKKFDARVQKLLGHNNFSYFCEPKIDGLAISLKYVDGKFVLGATRGNGIEGENVSENCTTLNGAPRQITKHIVCPKNLEVRGEVYISKKDFEQINLDRIAEGKEPFANARNAASGSLKLHDLEKVRNRKLSVLLYSIAESSGFNPKTQEDIYTFLQNLSFAVPSHTKKCSNIKEVLAYINKFDSLRRTLPYETDGMVIKINEHALYPQLGSTSKAPRCMIAYKFSAEQAITKVLSITHSVGKTGTITPVAELEPIHLAGSTISRASLHNYDEVKRKDIMVGDMVSIEKAGEIIPQIVSVCKDSRDGTQTKVITPSKCPVCQAPTVQKDNEVAIRCSNKNCPAIQLGKLTHFASKKCMDIEGLSSETIKVLYNLGFISSYSSLYSLYKFEDSLKTINSFGAKSLQKLFANIEKSKTRDLPCLLKALQIPNFGDHLSKIIVKYFSTLDEFMNCTKEQLESIPGLGKGSQKEILNYFSDSDNLVEIENLRKRGINFSAIKNDTVKTLDNKIIVITGSLEQPRNEIKKWLETLGASVSSTISKKTNYLIYGENAGSKLSKAQQISTISLYTLDDFKVKLKNGELN